MPEPRDTSSPEPGSLFRSPLALFSVCALTFMVSGIFLSGFHLQGMTFWVSGKVRLWHMLLALSPTLWVTSVLVMFHEWRTTRILGSGSRRQRLVAGAGVAVYPDGGGHRPARPAARTEGGELSIVARCRDGLLLLEVGNPRPARDDGRSSGSRVGLANASERLRLLFGERAKLELDLSLPDRAAARIQIPWPS
jgi:hypothetical protein